jgi:phosphoglycolate phosphatase
VPGAVRDDGVVTRFAPDALIFDFDGVIVDSYAAVTGSINAALVEHGLAARPAADAAPLHRPAHLHRLSRADRRARGLAGDRRDRRHLPAPLRRRVPDGDARDRGDRAGAGDAVGAASRSRSRPRSRSSSRSRCSTRSRLERFFAVVEAAASRRLERRQDGDRRPRARGARRARLPARPAMVGDRSFDVEAARAHGLPAIGVTWGIGSATELRGRRRRPAALAKPSELVALLVGRGPGRQPETVYLLACARRAPARRDQTSARPPLRSKEP